MLLDLRSREPRDWLVARTQPHKESCAIAHLERQGFRVYCPLIKRTVRHARRSRDVLRPLFPGYVFVANDRSERGWRPIIGTRGVHSLVCTGVVPSKLPKAVVDALKAREVDGLIVSPGSTMTVGQDVRIHGSALESLVGRIIEMRENERLILLVDILNRPTRVSVDIESVSPC